MAFSNNSNDMIQQKRILSTNKKGEINYDEWKADLDKTLQSNFHANAQYLIHKNKREKWMKRIFNNTYNKTSDEAFFSQKHDG